MVETSFMKQIGYMGVLLIAEEDCIYTTNFESKLLDFINPHSYGMCRNSLELFRKCFLVKHYYTLNNCPSKEM